LQPEEVGAQLWRSRELWGGHEHPRVEFEWLDACAQFVLTCEEEARSGRLNSQGQRLSWGINPALWAPVRGRSVSLRRLGLRDASQVHELLHAPDFLRSYARSLPITLPEIEDWLRAAQTPRWPVRRVEFVVVCNKSQRVIGLAALADLSVDDRRAELLVGISPNARRGALGSAGIEATCLLLSYAFDSIGLNKLVSYVYDDNPRALENTLHLGFSSEGALKEHVWDNGLNRFLSINVQALMRAEYEASALLRKLRARYLVDRKTS
jgi:RimJ/RimL family protein N-acetyltransferase